MSNCEDLPLFRKFYALIKTLYEYVHNFPKEYKYSLGREILELSWRCMDLFVESNVLSNELKSESIARLQTVFMRLKMRLRMAQEVHLISLGQFSFLQEQFILEIEKMSGGWQKWAVQKATAVK